MQLQRELVKSSRLSGQCQVRVARSSTERFFIFELFDQASSRAFVLPEGKPLCLESVSLVRGTKFTLLFNVIARNSYRKARKLLRDVSM